MDYTGVASGSQAVILDAAIAVIAQDGLEGLRTRTVAERAGVNVATLHYHFGTKERLLLAVLGHVYEKLGASLLEQEQATDSFRDQFHAHLEAALRTFRNEPELGIVLQELRIRAMRDQAARRAFQRIQDAWGSIVYDIVSNAVKAHETRREVDARSCAFMVTSCIMGMTMQLLLHPKAFNASRVVAELERSVFD